MAVTAFAVGMAVCTPVALAGQAAGSKAVPPPKTYGYAAGPAQRDGTAADRSHYVPRDDGTWPGWPS